MDSQDRIAQDEYGFNLQGVGPDSKPNTSENSQTTLDALAASPAARTELNPEPEKILSDTEVAIVSWLQAEIPRALVEYKRLFDTYAINNIADMATQFEYDNLVRKRQQVIDWNERYKGLVGQDHPYVTATEVPLLVESQEQGAPSLSFLRLQQQYDQIQIQNYSLVIRATQNWPVYKALIQKARASGWSEADKDNIHKYVDHKTAKQFEKIRQLIERCQKLLTLYQTENDAVTEMIANRDQSASLDPPNPNETTARLNLIRASIEIVGLMRALNANTELRPTDNAGQSDQLDQTLVQWLDRLKDQETQLLASGAIH